MMVREVSLYQRSLMSFFLSGSWNSLGLAGTKREFADLDDDEEELYPSKKVENPS